MGKEEIFKLIKDFQDKFNSLPQDVKQEFIKKYGAPFEEPEDTPKNDGKDLEE